MRPLIHAATLAVAFVSGLFATGMPDPSFAASETVPAEERVIPYAASLPICADPSVLTAITKRFAEKEAQFWNSSLEIVSYEKIRPIAFRAWGLDTIPRRFCTAAATTSDGRVRRVDFSVRESLGFIGNGWSVEWCVDGLDRNLAFSPSCRMARP